jgi:hypothetical protein
MCPIHLNAEGRLEHDPMTWRSWLGVVATCLVGMVGSVLAAVPAVLLAYTYDTSWTTTFVWFTILLSVPTVALWRMRDRYGYCLALGLVVGWAAVSLWMWFGTGVVAMQYYDGASGVTVAHSTVL